MRSLTYLFALFLAAALMPAQAAASDPADAEVAEQIARNLKQSGQLKNYKIGIKFNDGVAWLVGTVTDPGQERAALDVAERSAGVVQAVSKLTVASPQGRQVGLQQPTSLAAAPHAASGFAGRHAQGGQHLPARHVQASPQMMSPQMAASPAWQTRGPNVPLPVRPAGGQMPMPGGPGGPMPMYAGAAGGVSPARYDEPNMPGYAWPSYASYPNYAALTYPRQYSATAWPYIGPFYPYPQVPLGWRKVTLEWDDGWWHLDFKD